MNAFELDQVAIIDEGLILVHHTVQYCIKSVRGREQKCQRGSVWTKSTTVHLVL